MLSLVEAVNFVYEQYCTAAGGSPARRFEDFAQHRHIGEHAARATEAAFGAKRHDLGDRRLAASGRSVENDAGEAVGVYDAPQEFAGADDVLLAGDFVERARAHARRQGLFPRWDATIRGQLQGIVEFVLMHIVHYNQCAPGHATNFLVLRTAE